MAEAIQDGAKPAAGTPLLTQEETLTADTFIRGLWKENPVFVMLLGMCPTLAVTNTTLNALGMGLSTTFVLVFSGILVSLLRHWIPKQVRIASYIVIIATFVTLVDYAIQAISLELYAALGAFIQLIVVNCIILGRAEAYASKQRVLTTIVNSLGNGTLLGVSLFGPDFQPWLVMILPPGGFFVLGAWLLFFNWLRLTKVRRAAQFTGAPADAR